MHPTEVYDDEQQQQNQTDQSCIKTYYVDLFLINYI